MCYIPTCCKPGVSYLVKLLLVSAWYDKKALLLGKVIPVRLHPLLAISLRLDLVAMMMLALNAMTTMMVVRNMVRSRSLCSVPHPPACGSAGQRDFCLKILFPPLWQSPPPRTRRNISLPPHFAPSLFQCCSSVNLGFPSKDETCSRKVQIFHSLI